MLSAYGGGEVGATMTWEDEMMSLVDDAWFRYPDAMGEAAAAASSEERDAMDRSDRTSASEFHETSKEEVVVLSETLRDQVGGFLRATGELVAELSRGCWDIMLQSLAAAQHTFVGKKMKGKCVSASRKLGFLNAFLPEDRDPTQAWPVVICVFSLSLMVNTFPKPDGYEVGGKLLWLQLAVLIVSSGNAFRSQPQKKLYVSPPSASRIQLPDGRYIAYHEQGVAAKDARFSVMVPHSFLSSRFAGIPGISTSLLEEYGVRLITYDLPGFGESDPHPGRNLTSSALDMHQVANALGVVDKFWVVGLSSGGLHAWAALRYIPDQIAGAAMFAPIVNPYDSSMNKAERRRTWENWTSKRRLMFILARRFSSLLPYFYRRSFLSGRLGQPEKWLSLSLGEKDKSLLEEPKLSEFWVKNVAESVRQGESKPFVEEAVLQVSNWGFTLADLQVQKQPERKCFLPWLRSLYQKPELKRTGFLGPIHIWQGMDDNVVPPSMIVFIKRMVPAATIHKLPNEGHFSYFWFCDVCHRQIFSTLFGVSKGPLGNVSKAENSEGYNEELTSDTNAEKERLEEVTLD
ncbi:hypothetical protein ZIOFF_044884 [Zingiber officinale]|uniref:AB hydrolase-1 domain-containing protein n=1 Tax=Zingiber officinale TaxID=94328 RepID=A0A8J5FW30_ZINOF|nr:hypothetical protein ZIOFF_044884 [Zingiber officinale]